MSSPKSEAEAVLKFRPFVIKIARHFKSNASFSEDDLIQEGLIAVALAYRQWDPQTPGANFLSWISKPVYYAMLKQVRQHKRRGGTYMTKGAHVTSMDGPMLEESKHRHEANDDTTLHDVVGTFEEPPDFLALERLPDLVALLDPLERRVIRLRYEEGLTCAEVGEELSYSREHIRKVSKRALEKLKASFTKEDIGS